MMPHKKIPIDKMFEMLSRLQQGDSEAFSELFNHFYTDLVLFAGNFIPIKEVCEDMVQSVFLVLWHERENIIIETSLKSYLLRAVRNRCFDHLRHLDVHREYNEYITKESILCEYDTENYIFYSDLHSKVKDAIEKLPIHQREVLLLSRFEGLKYKEISKRLNVSERTVEVRMSDALKKMRHLLKDYLTVLLSLFFC